MFAINALIRQLHTGRLGDGAALAAGALLPLAFAPLALFPLAWFAPALLFLLWQDAPPRLAARRGFLFGVGMFGVGVSWVYVAIHDFGYTGMPVAALLTAVFVAILALYPAALGYLTGRMQARVPNPALRLLLLYPALWVAFEWLRGWFLTGFPWLHLGYSQVDTPLAGLAPLFGVYGLGWATAFTAAALAAWFVAPRRTALIGTALALTIWGLGAAVHGKEWTEPIGAPLRVSLIQGNQPQLETWDPQAMWVRLQAYADLNATRLGKSDLIVWPENAVTLFYQDLADDYFAPLAKQAQEAGSDLLLGVPLLDEDGVRYYTTMMSLGSSHGFYKKSHLVPFGEFVPMEGMLRGLIGFFDLPMSAFSAGPLYQRPLEVAGRKAAVSVCYEDAFGEEVIRALPAAELLVNGSNNAWYGDSFAPHQHLQISRMRALETGRPLLRATTNGISALVDPLGNVIASSRQFEVAIVDGTVQPMRGATLYVRWGNMPVLAGLFAIGFILWACIARRRCT
jgi:apolipoprotein N-acyltransferase